MELTTKEAAVLAALWAESESNGHDFGVLEVVNYKKLKLTGQQFGGLVTSLQNKGLFDVYEPFKVNGEYFVTQFVFTEVGLETAEGLSR